MSRTTTRKQLICEKYQETINKIKNVLPIFNFPVIGEDIDFIDLVFLFNHYFVPANESNYTQIIDDFIKQNQNYQSICIITTEQQQQLNPIFKEFIFWFKSLQ